LIASGKQAAVKAGLDKAFRDFTEAIRVDPDYPGGYTERGMILFKRGESERAIADYTAALTRDANYAPALRGRGMAHLYRGATDLAIADPTKAILLAENDPSRLSALDLFYARRSRAALYGEKQRYDGEIADCTAIIQSYQRDLALGDDLKASYGGGASSLIAMIYRQRANAYLQRSNRAYPVNTDTH
jgi:tetratricopeptide (TPR) repeat protein